MKLGLTNEVKIVIWQIGNAAMMCKDDDITSAEYEKISLDAINGLVNVDEKSDSNCNLDIVSKRSELLIAFCRFLFTEMNYTTETDYTPEEQVEVFLKSNL